MTKAKIDQWTKEKEKLVETDNSSDLDKSDRKVKKYISVVSLGISIGLLVAGLLALGYYFYLLQSSSDYTFFKLTPYYFFLPVVLLFSSVVAYQIYLRARELTRRGLYSSFFLPFLILTDAIIALIAGREIIRYLDLSRAEHIKLGNYFGIAFYEILVLCGFMFFILFPLSAKFVRGENKRSNETTWSLVIFAAIIIIPLAFYYGKTLSSFTEKPFVGANKAQEFLGVKPVSFELSGFPKGYELMDIKETRKPDKISIIYNNETKNMTGRVLVEESTKDPIDSLVTFTYKKQGPIAGTRAQYFESSDENLLYFLKNNLFITISANKAALSVEELENIADTAK